MVRAPSPFRRRHSCPAAAATSGRARRPVGRRWGARVFCQPAFEIHPPASWEEVDRAISSLDETDWLIFSSRNGVSFFLDRLLEVGRDLRSLGKVKLAAVGPGTAQELRDRRLLADLVPDKHRAEALALALGAAGGG